MDKITKFNQSPIIQITQESPDSSQQPITSNYNQMTNRTTSSKGDTSMASNNLEMINANQDYSDSRTSQQVIEKQTSVYKKRFYILALFCAHSAINSFQWIQYSSITDVISNYYNASNLLVNLTSVVFMVTYIPFIISASVMLERVGLRKAVVLGTLGTALGSLIKWSLGGQPGLHSFWWMMLGQTVVALSQLYIISIPPLLAAVWFPDQHVSTATGVGVFGNQLGIALGFIVPPLAIRDVRASRDLIGSDLNSLSFYVFLISSIICALSILTFEDKPPKPPGSASLKAANQVKTETQAETYASILELCRDRDFKLLIISYGINVGCFYAVSTCLSQMVQIRWSELHQLAGTMGLLLVVSGMAGSVVCGQLLDRTHAYKLVIVLIYFFSLVSMIKFTLVVEFSSQIWPLYLVSIILGFFMTGYLPLGFEFAAEITYPHPANTPAGLLNLSAQIFGLALTYSTSMMVDSLGNMTANCFLSGCLVAGLILTVIMKADLKRQKAVDEEDMKL